MQELNAREGISQERRQEKGIKGEGTAGAVIGDRGCLV